MTDFTTWAATKHRSIVDEVARIDERYSISQRLFLHETVIAVSQRALANAEGNRDVDAELDLKAWRDLGANRGKA